MSPARCALPTSPAVSAALARLWLNFGARVRESRVARRWTTVELARRSGVSRTTIYTIERGGPVSIEIAARVAAALGLRLELDLVETRRTAPAPNRQRDLLHSEMGNFEAGQLRRQGIPVGLDEPYQHYQFAGRADLVAWDVRRRALLHIENRTIFPDFQEMAGAYNSKRAYLPRVLGERLGIRSWRSETHAIVALWSSDVLRALRLRTDSFRALCPNDASAFDAWWRGQPPAEGRVSTFVVLDPLASGRQRSFIDLDAALIARPRYRGYAEAAAAIRRHAESRV